MKETKISSSNLSQVRASMQSGSYEPTSSDAPAKGSKGNPYTWNEYYTMINSEEPLSSSFFFLNENGDICFSMADLVITSSGNSGYNGGSSYEGGSNYSGISNYSGDFGYQSSSVVFDLSYPDNGPDILDVIYDKYSGTIGSLMETASNYLGDAGAFPTAVTNYYSGSPVDLTLNINSLGLNCLTKDIIRKQNNGNEPQIGDKIYINLSDIGIISDVIIQAKSVSDIACYLSTAVAIGGITFTCVNTDEYEINCFDTYNFDWKKVKVDDDQMWKTLRRNFATVLGKVINEGICICIDDLLFGPFGILLGIKNRYITGTTEFRIYFTGRLKIKR